MVLGARTAIYILAAVAIVAGAAAYSIFGEEHEHEEEEGLLAGDAVKVAAVGAVLAVVAAASFVYLSKMPPEET